MAVHKELSFSIGDLRYVSVTCDRCHTEIVLDMANEYNPGREGFSPSACPTCGDPFEPTVKPAVDHFKAIYISLKGLRGRIAFRVDPGEDSEE